MKFVSINELSGLGKTAVGAVVSMAGLLQLPDVKNVVIPLVAHHPHLSTLAGALVTLGALLANPEVQKVLHLKTEIVTTSTTTNSVIEKKS